MDEKTEIDTNREKAMLLPLGFYLFIQYKTCCDNGLSSETFG